MTAEPPDLTSVPDATGWRALASRRYAPALAVVCLGVWLHAADSLLVATMLPEMVHQIGGHALVAWTVALYEVGSIVAGAASGLMAVRHGVRRPMVVAALLFAVGCTISASAPSMPVVLVGRLLQGLGGGGLMALSFVSVGLLFPKPLMPQALAAVSTLWGVSAFLGPLIGGAFVEYANWRAGFGFFALQALAQALWIATGPQLEAGPPRTTAPGRLPVWRLLALSAGVVLIAAAGIEVTVVRTSLLVLAGLVCLALFLWQDARRVGSRLLPSRPIGLATPAGAALTMILCLSAATIAITAYGPLLVTELHGVAPLTAGYIVASASIAWTVAAVAVSGFPERHDPRFIAAGMTLASLSVAGFAFSVPHGPVWLIAVCSAMEGAGFGMAWTFILRRATSLAPAGETERVAAAMPTVQRLGYALGAAYVGIVANAAGYGDSHDRAAVADAASLIFLACLPLAAIGLLAMLRFVRPSWPAARAPQDDSR